MKDEKYAIMCILYLGGEKRDIVALALPRLS